MNVLLFKTEVLCLRNLMRKAVSVKHMLQSVIFKIEDAVKEMCRDGKMI